MNDIFWKFAQRASPVVGNQWSFIAALLLVSIWLVGGLAFGFTDSWLLLINTFATVTTFLIVFLIQNTQNRHTKTVHLKLDELIRSTKQARGHLLNIEQSPEDELNHLQKEFSRLRQAETKHHQSQKKRR